MAPPSFKPLPLLGNMLSIPTKAPWKTYAAWSKELNSDLITVWVLGTPMIIVNTGKAALELLSRRSANYGDRPRVPMLDLQGWTDTVTSLMPYGDRWRGHRRMLHLSFNLNVVSGYNSTQTEQIKAFLHNLYASPNQFSRHIEHLTASLAIMVAYGYQVEDENDPLLSLVTTAVHFINHPSVSSSIVNIIPALKHLPEWFPGAGFLTIGRECRELLARIRNEPFNRLKRFMVLGRAPPSVTTSLLQASDSASPEDEEVIKEVAAMVYMAGAETSSTALQTMILALVLNPEVQRRAQGEIDAVTERKRLPTYDDRKSLPYVEAIVRETLRWSPVVPLGVFRSTLNCDTYDGWFIPSGTTVLWNAWAICHDTDVYPEPDAFHPERFLDAKGHLALDEERAVFGYGRRECVGIHFARDTLYLAAAMMLALFKFGKDKDEHGNEIEIRAEYMDGIISHPRKFACAIRPRDERSVALLETSA